MTKNVTDPEVMWGETSRKYSYSSKKVHNKTNDKEFMFKVIGR